MIAFHRSVILATGILILMLAAAGCTRLGRPVARGTSEPSSADSVFVTPRAPFSRALGACRRLRGGSADRRSATPAQHPVIARCLAGYGWSPDAIPLLRSSPAEVAADRSNDRTPQR